jgi:hypothetical protein
VLRIGCSRAPRTKGRKVASKKHAEPPFQRTGRQKGHKQAPGWGGARELRPAGCFVIGRALHPEFLTLRTEVSEAQGFENYSATGELDFVAVVAFVH